MNLLNDDYWSDRYEKHQTGWDIGMPSAPLKAYIDQLKDKNISILIPGCGNAYEAAYLLENGFTNITLIDISHSLVQSLKGRFAGQKINILLGDFFHHRGQYDLILEQTFFCALDPGLRMAYAQKMHQLLKTDGKLAGVLFNRPFEGGPPFGGNIIEYRQYFNTLFQIKILGPCYNSILPRANAEAFFIIQKKG